MAAAMAQASRAGPLGAEVSADLVLTFVWVELHTQSFAMFWKLSTKSVWEQMNSTRGTFGFVISPSQAVAPELSKAQRALGNSASASHRVMHIHWGEALMHDEPAEYEKSGQDCWPGSSFQAFRLRGKAHGQWVAN